jgi:HTH-type transcriptional regulator/antitoxin HigA
METIKYSVIKTEEQYDHYCTILKELVFNEEAEKKQEEIELLTLLIENWDENHRLRPEPDPVTLINMIMDEHNLNQTDIAKIAGVGKSYISQILHYKKCMSKKIIRRLANHFKIRQEALNKPYPLEDKKETNHRVFAH